MSKPIAFTDLRKRQNIRRNNEYLHEQFDCKDEILMFYTSMYSNTSSSVASFLVMVYST